MEPPIDLESYFHKFREGIVGIDARIDGPLGSLPLVYADWVASGRLYAPIENTLTKDIGPWTANTHSESSQTGRAMTLAYHRSQAIIKAHVNAGEKDILILCGSGMTAAVNKLQRILGLKVPESLRDLALSESFSGKKRPVVFLTHMEHHSNHTSWLETLAEVVVLEPGDGLMVDLARLEEALDRYRDRELKIGSFTACSNVTGIQPPYYELARIMHRHGGLCFVDFAASAPYVDIDMHPQDPQAALDAIYFSPHKFLGGPGSAGVLILDSRLNLNRAPDQPGGGTVLWTNRWGEYHYLADLESKEDGGTPAFLQSMRAALAIRLKDSMGTAFMHAREKQLLKRAFSALDAVPGLKILAPDVRNRLAILSFYIENIHYNLVVRLLSDRYGIQVRGGCSCAGTYGHYLLNVDREKSRSIACSIESGDLSEKPGWVRLSLHPCMSDDELDYILEAIAELSRRGRDWARDYRFMPEKTEFEHISWKSPLPALIDSWFGGTSPGLSAQEQS